MAARLPKAARAYLQQLTTALSALDHAERQRIVQDTRVRLATLPGRGRRQQEIIEALGPVDSYAANFAKVEPKALEVSSGNYFLRRILAWPTFGFALLTALVLLCAPGAGFSIALGFDGIGGFGDGYFGYVERADPAWLNLSLMPAVLVALVPALFSLTPLLVQGKGANWLQLLAALVMSTVAVLAGAGIGLFLLPAVILLWSQVLVPPVLMRHSMGRPGSIWRSVGMLVILGIVALAVFSTLREGTWWALVFPVLLLVAALGHAMRWWWAEIALIAIGLGTILYAALLLPAPTELFLTGAIVFIVGHLGLAGNMWSRRSANLLALL